MGLIDLQLLRDTSVLRRISSRFAGQPTHIGMHSVSSVVRYMRSLRETACCMSLQGKFTNSQRTQVIYFFPAAILVHTSSRYLFSPNTNGEEKVGTCSII